MVPDGGSCSSNSSSNSESSVEIVLEINNAPFKFGQGYV